MHMRWATGFHDNVVVVVAAVVENYDREVGG